MKTALVTGDRGFVGRHFTEYLLEHGWGVGGVDLARGVDCRDYFKHSDARYDLVVHLAAIVGGRKIIEGDPMSVATDLSIDAEMFNWAVRTKQRRVVYFSSSAAYPVDLQRPGAPPLVEADIDLAHPQMPDFSYGWAKLTGEQLARYAKRSYGLPVHVLRPFSGYGASQALDYPFPSFVHRARAKADPFEVWGDGEQVRDFVHIDDVIRGTMAVVEADYREPVNLCTGRGISFNQLAAMMAYQANYQPSIWHHLDGPVGVQHRVGDPTLMEKFYTPKISLEQGIAEALQ